MRSGQAPYPRPAVVMSGPFTEDVRGGPWPPMARRTSDVADEYCAMGEGDDPEPRSEVSEASEPAAASGHGDEPTESPR